MLEVQKDNELVVIEMPTTELLRLSEQINNRLIETGYPAGTINAVVPGLNLESSWPFGAGPTLAQLVVIAKKLDMKITISNLYVEPHKERTQ
ncbi:MAG: hypothetical protein WC877_03385 [Dehalococcoidales bacterium]|jgi:hypothetical protein|nr:hypothetical protein [Candidatus Neomarinimicrobiota bacterium]MDD5220462.1 hypothetical protein [Candidatus Bipolaricaulis sp.]